MTDIPAINLFDGDYDLPRQETTQSAGLDLRARLDDPIDIPAGIFVWVPVGIQLDMTQTNLCALVLARSGLGGRGLTLTNGVGLIDPDFQGEIQVSILNLTGQTVRLNRGDRIGQLLFLPQIPVNLTTTDTFETASERGENGMGSTGLE